MTIPASWRGPFSPRDPLKTPRPRNQPEPVQTVAPDPNSPPAQTAVRVEHERDLLGEALDQLGGRLRRRAQ